MSPSATKAAKAEKAEKAEKAARTAKPEQAEAAQAGAATDAAAVSVLAPETLARTLRAVADELERDPALARRVAAAIRESLTAGDAPLNAVAEEYAAPAKARKGSKPRAFKPTLVAGASPDLGTGVIDPFALRERLGEDGLRRALGELRLGSLRAILREHRLDPAGKLAGVNDAERLRSAILHAVGS